MKLKPICRALLPGSIARSNPTAGFTMIEVLVALVILSIGLLGLAGLQTTGLKGSHASLMRSQASQAADDILDRMRANRAVAIGGGYDMTLAQTPATSGASNLALTDLTEWMTTVAANLPAGDASVAVVDPIATVVIQWNDGRDANTITVVSRL